MRRQFTQTLMILPVPMWLLAAPATAQEIPDFDSAGLCEEVAGHYGEAAVRRCQFAEDYGLSELETFWPTTTTAIRERCIEQLKEESYAELARCVLRLRRAR
jgi:hypothetical protein